MIPTETNKTDVTFLYDLSRKISNSDNFESALLPILKLTSDHLGITCCVLTIVRSNTTDIISELVYGFNDEEKQRVRSKIKNQVLEKIIETGQSILIPKISRQPQFITSSRDLVDFKYEISLIGVPIKVGKEIYGVLSFSLEYYEDISFKSEFRILNVICSMIAQILHVIQDRSEEVEHLKQENQYLHEKISQGFKSMDIIGNSSQMQIVFDLVHRVAKTNATVLLRGESGVGKELIANAIHYNSDRVDKTFIKVNCAALPETLIESELFGHEKGAFTGADQLRKGRFELADGGTIFLDEIGDLPMNTQVKLLRVLQEKEFERLGSANPIKIDVRIITATNRNLEEMVTSGKFREDLFYRLDVFPMYIPALRERRNDIPILVNHFIAKSNQKHNLNIKRIDTPAIDLLMVYHWPGNIRELENCIERSSIMSTDDVIRAHNLPPTLQTAASSHTEMKGTLDDIIGNIEKQVIIDNLVTHDGSIQLAARDLGITERILRLRIEKYEIDHKRFRVKKK